MPRAASQSTQQRRQQAIETLLELASEGPPSQIRTAQISERMGLSEAALFRHFPSKEHLWLATLEDAIARAWAPVDHLLAMPALQDKPLEALKEVLRSQFSINRSIPGLPTLIFHELQSRSPSPCRVVVIEHLERFRQCIEDLVRSAQALQMLSQQATSEALADTLLALMMGLLLQEQIRGCSPGQAEAKLDASLGLVLQPFCIPA